MTSSKALVKKKSFPSTPSFSLNIVKCRYDILKVGPQFCDYLFSTKAESLCQGCAPLFSVANLSR